MLTSGAALARVICKTANGRDGCSCETGGVVSHCVSMEEAGHRAMMAAGLAWSDVEKILSGPVTVRRKPCKKGGAE